MTAELAAATRIAREVQATRPLPSSFQELDPQARRKVGVEARWHRTTPEAYYREALSDRLDAASTHAITDDVLSAVRTRR